MQTFRDARRRPRAGAMRGAQRLNACRKLCRGNAVVSLRLPCISGRQGKSHPGLLFNDSHTGICQRKCHSKRCIGVSVLEPLTVTHSAELEGGGMQQLAVELEQALHTAQQARDDALVKLADVSAQLEASQGAIDALTMYQVCICMFVCVWI